MGGRRASISNHGCGTNPFCDTRVGHPHDWFIIQGPSAMMTESSNLKPISKRDRVLGDSPNMIPGLTHAPPAPGPGSAGALRFCDQLRARSPCLTESWGTRQGGSRKLAGLPTGSHNGLHCSWNGLFRG